MRPPVAAVWPRPRKPARGTRVVLLLPFSPLLLGALGGGTAWKAGSLSHSRTVSEEALWLR